MLRDEVLRIWPELAWITDEDLREKTAKRWIKEHGNKELKASDIVCHGCLSDKEVYSYCKVCKIRACGLEKKVSNCGKCPDYACDVVKKFHEQVPEAKEGCDAK